ncbi:hypothetical protein GCM10011531_07110 [Aquaticitalea lipolytica]|uniref:Methyltransferase type 11 domain-containing protein n=1 Tax=Aquaticitalea lipolytica TaxID=1247562 RepID=A0A8J2TLC1_9FLAO|nr:hypothetical protein [Aquaticitalea lipolytica]GFZ79766.1 hypothetical protein GCM10011531_07110 [Aquaticitalea lipolytica]
MNKKTELILPKTISKLNIACGSIKENIFPRPWLNIDIKSEYADFELNSIELPDEWENRFWEVRASHVIEHFFLEDWEDILNQWIKVLKPGGILRLSLPDLAIVLKHMNSIDNLDHKKRPVLSLEEQTAALTQLYGVGYMHKNTESRWRHRIICNKEIVLSFLDKIPSLSKAYNVSKELDISKVLNINDDSQNSWSMTICARKNILKGNEEFGEKDERLFEFTNLLIFNKEGQLLVLKGNNGFKLPKIEIKSKKYNTALLVSLVQKKYKVIITNIVFKSFFKIEKSEMIIITASLKKVLKTSKSNRHFLLSEEFLQLENLG